MCGALAKAITSAYERLAESHGGGGLGPGGENPVAIDMLPIPNPQPIFGTTMGDIDSLRAIEEVGTALDKGGGGFGMGLFLNGLLSFQCMTINKKKTMPVLPRDDNSQSFFSGRQTLPNQYFT